MLGLMLVLTVSSAYKHTFALGDSLSLGGNLIAAGVDWRRWLPCPSHLESEEKLRLINIQRLVELDCSRGVKYWKSMCTHICNICVHIYMQYFMLPHHFSMVLASALLSCGIYKLISLLNPLWALTAGLSWTFLFYWLSNKHMHIILHANLHRRSMTIMFSIFGFQNHVFTCKKAIIWLRRRDVVWYLQERDW